ncbi:hypothetical protein DMP38_27275 [Klebsiella pneumoniae]|nr:hypothetical protein DMP38_27275 [Klebsiella pneumoniae]
MSATPAGGSPTPARLPSAAGTQTVAVFIWRQFEQGSVGQGMAMASLTLLTGLVLMLTALALMQRRTRG